MCACVLARVRSLFWHRLKSIVSGWLSVHQLPQCVCVKHNAHYLFIHSTSSFVCWSILFHLHRPLRELYQKLLLWINSTPLICHWPSYFHVIVSCVTDICRSWHQGSSEVWSCWIDAVGSCVVTICAPAFFHLSTASVKLSHFFCYNDALIKLIKGVHCHTHSTVSLWNVFNLEQLM